MKVAIVGGSPDSEHLAPFDTDYKMWVLGNRCTNYAGRVDKIFEIHEDLEGIYDEKKYFKALTDLGIPLVVSRQFPHKADHIEVFPFERLKEIPNCRPYYFMSSAAYMVAYAILEGAKEIALYGINMSVNDDEYFRQKPNIEYWLSKAEHMGIKITTPDNCPLLKSEYTYGIGRQREVGKDSGIPFNTYEFSLLIRRHEKVIMDLQREIAEKEKDIIAHSGTKQAYQTMYQMARSYEAGCRIDSINGKVLLKGEKACK